MSFDILQEKNMSLQLFERYHGIQQAGPINKLVWMIFALVSMSRACMLRFLAVMLFGLQRGLTKISSLNPKFFITLQIAPRLPEFLGSSIIIETMRRKEWRLYIYFVELEFGFTLLFYLRTYNQQMQSITDC